LVAVSHTLSSHVEGPKIRGRWGLAPPNLAACLTIWKHVPHMCYGTEFGRSTPNHMGVGGGVI